MLFFNLRAAKEKLAQGILPDRDLIPYLLVVMAILSLVAPGWSTKDDLTLWSNLLPSMIIAIWGTHYLYRCNGGAAGREFLQRYLVLGWVVSLRYVIAAFPICLLIYSISYRETWAPTVEWAQRIIIVAIELGYYFYAGFHFRSLARMNRDISDKKP